jgi:uncharacterized protein (DUF1015 family)
LYLKDVNCYYFLKVKEKIKEELAKENLDESDLNLLDVSILTNIIFKKALGLTEKDLDNPAFVSYFSSVKEALAAVCEQDHRAGFIINPTSLNEILKVTESGLVMPRKATYFYPKVSNGLVFNLIDPLEVIPNISND